MTEYYPAMKMTELLIHSRNMGESHKPGFEGKNSDTEGCIYCNISFT